MPQLTRRHAIAATSAALLSPASAFANPSGSFAVDDIRTISLQTDRYHGWPTMIRRKNGELLIACSGGRETHVCPFGRVEMIRSFDNGESWTYARTILDGPLDDRDAGIVETAKGTLLATTFTSLAYEPILKRGIESASTDKPSMSPERLKRWQAAHSRTPEGRHQQRLGCWMVSSEDGGENWSPAWRVPCNSPHGPIVLNDGQLFYAGISLWEEGRPVGCWASNDDGRTWKLLSRIPIRTGDSESNYHELHAVHAADGRIVVHIRNHNKQHSRETLQTHSTDGGKTFAEPYSIGVWGLPSHLLRLSDDRLLMSYGHRRAPLGNQVRISDDHGRTWSDALIIHDNAVSGDLGYPSTVELSPGKLATAWYEKEQGSSLAQLRLARWRLV